MISRICQIMMQLAFFLPFFYFLFYCSGCNACQEVFANDFDWSIHAGGIFQGRRYLQRDVFNSSRHRKCRQQRPFHWSTSTGVSLLWLSLLSQEVCAFRGLYKAHDLVSLGPRISWYLWRGFADVFWPYRTTNGEFLCLYQTCAEPRIFSSKTHYH